MNIGAGDDLKRPSERWGCTEWKGHLPQSAGLKDVWASSLFSLASSLNAERGGGGGERGGGGGWGGYKNAWVTQKRRDDGGVTGGWDERGIAVGGALRNAWKVSERSGRHWTDNPAHHNTTRSPTALISPPLSVCLLSLKPIRRAHRLLTFTCHVLPQKKEEGP